VLAACVPPENFRVIIHTVGAIKSDLDVATDFLDYNGIKFLRWKSEFDSAAAQYTRLHALQAVNRSDQLILQADIDEFPDLSHLKFMSETLLQKESPCDVFSGILLDRLPRDGSLQNVSHNDDLDKKFPLRCEVKKTLEKAAHKKIVLYRASFRSEVGNHRLRCQRAFSVDDCLRKKLRYEELYPKMTHTPRQCSSRIMPVLIGDVSKSPLLHAPGAGQSSGFGHTDNKIQDNSILIDHFKYVWGLQSYLEHRVEIFKKRKIYWYKESQNLLNHLQHNGGRICTECTELNCKDISK
jgi:hypothetical protein